MRSALIPILLLAVPVLAGPRAPSTAVAMVTDAQGELRRGEDPAPVAITSEVEAGLPLKLKAGARLTLLMYGSGEEVRLSGPGTFTLDAKGSVSGPTAGIRRTKGPELDLKEALKPGGLAQASLVMRGPFDIDLEEPTQPVVRTARPRFRWVPVKGATIYSLSLRKAGGDGLLAITTREPAFDLPEGLQLQPGVTYQWSLSTALPGVRVLQSEGELAVLDETRSQALDRLRAAAATSFSQRLVYASTLQVYGLLAEAKVEWRALASQRPEDPMLQAFAR
ncbi:MAG: hypothetical protein P4L11_12785 [Geothrix sp.]|nr:hypothetical protein [Geothrix sp.]